MTISPLCCFQILPTMMMEMQEGLQRLFDVFLRMQVAFHHIIRFSL